MVKKFYQVQIADDRKTARAFLSNQRISTKFAMEVCSEIKGWKLDKAEMFLNNVLSHKQFLPLKHFRLKVAHRRGNPVHGTKSGRYPERVCLGFLKLLNLVKANADFKGLDSENLFIVHAFASQGFKRFGNQSKGRISGKRKARKAAHIEVIVREGS